MVYSTLSPSPFLSTRVMVAVTVTSAATAAPTTARVRTAAHANFFMWKLRTPKRREPPAGATIVPAGGSKLKPRTLLAARLLLLDEQNLRHLIVLVGDE